MPLALLGRCILPGYEAGDGAFAASTTFAKAMLAAAKVLRLTLQVVDCNPSSLAAVLSWVPAGLDIHLHLVGAKQGHDSRLYPLLHMLQQAVLRLPGVTVVHCKGLVLDANVPGLDVLFPNLQELHLHDCKLPPGTLPLTACHQLQRLELSAALAGIVDLTASGNWAEREPPSFLPEPDAWAAQLASLPATLTSLAITSGRYPTSFLPSLAGQLTELHLHRDSWGRDEPHWQQTMAFTAQLGATLHTLHINKARAADIALLSGLTGLEDLQFGVCGSGGDVIGAVLRLPSVTRLTMGLGRIEPDSPSHADSPCTWKELRLKDVTPELLSRLPLHSLTVPLQISELRFDEDTTLADVQAAVANLRRSQAPVSIAWLPDAQTVLTVDVDANDYLDGVWGYADGDDNPAALLRAAGPLLPQGPSLTIYNGVWNAAMLIALQSMVPHTVKTLGFSYCNLTPSFWPQLARSFPDLHCLKVEYLLPEGSDCSHESVLEYYLSAQREQPEGQPGGPKAATIHLTLDDPPQEGEEEEEGFEEVNQQLRDMGFKAQVFLAFSQ